jgi:hypothetical protein
MDEIKNLIGLLLCLGIMVVLGVLNNRLQKARRADDSVFSLRPLARSFLMPEFYLFFLVLFAAILVIFVFAGPPGSISR